MKNKNAKSFILNFKRLLRKMIIMHLKNKKKVMYCLNIFLIASIFALLFTYLIESNEAAGEGFTMKELNSQLLDLRSSNKELKLQSAELQSIERIKQESVERLDMTLSNGRDYIVLSKTKNIVKK